MKSNVQLTFSSEETDSMAHSASDFFSSQFTFWQMRQCRFDVVVGGLGGAQCETYWFRIDKVVAVEGQADVDMVSWLSAFARGLLSSLSPVRGGILCPLSGCHDVLVDKGMAQWMDGQWMDETGWDGAAAGMPVEWCKPKWKGLHGMECLELAARV